MAVNYEVGGRLHAAWVCDESISACCAELDVRNRVMWRHHVPVQAHCVRTVYCISLTLTLTPTLIGGESRIWEGVRQGIYRGRSLPVGLMGKDAGGRGTFGLKCMFSGFHKKLVIFCKLNYSDVPWKKAGQYFVNLHIVCSIIDGGHIR